MEVQGAEPSTEEEVREEKFQSAVPLLPPLSEQTVQMYGQFYVCAVGFIILFGGLLSPILEVRMGLGGELHWWQYFGFENLFQCKALVAVLPMDGAVATGFFKELSAGQD